MPSIETVYTAVGNQIILFGCGFCLVRVIEFSLDTGKHHLYYIVFNAFNAVLLFGISMVITGMVREYPASIFLLTTSVMLSGPLNLLFYQQVLNPKKPTRFAVWTHLTPAMVVFIIDILFQLQPAGVKKELIASFMTHPMEHIFTVPFLLIVTHVIVYFIVIVRTILSDTGPRESRLESWFLLTIVAKIIMSIIMLFFGFIFHLTWLIVAGGVLITFVHIAYFLGQRVFPALFITLRSQIRKKRYDRYVTAGIDPDIVRNRLIDLMEDEKLFLDCDISLNLVSDKLSVKPHQFSLMLNSVFGTGFWDLINRYRIEEAVRLISADPEVNVLSVCYRAGFNSKSSFNAAFKKFTGTTPTKYKIKSLKN